MTPELAEHYGLPVEHDTATWVDYGDSGRGGILSHGSVLSLGAKFDDTSPTTRRLEIRERLMCQTIALPPDSGVNTDDPPPGANPDGCKIERYAQHRSEAACAGCHELTDGIGFGLENYDSSGAFREHDTDRPECPIEGEGLLVEVGEFKARFRISGGQQRGVGIGRGG